MLLCKESTKALGQHHKSIVKEAVDRLEEKMAIGQSRRQAKQALRATGAHVWTHSTELIHSFKTRSVYQGHVVRFVKWARSTHQIQNLTQLDTRSDELSSIYLRQHIDEGKSPYTLQAERSALRLFFGNRALAQDALIPRRARANITRSRGPKGHDRHFQAANWQPLLKFLQATGLRRNEARNLRVCDIIASDPDFEHRPTVRVVNGKGGKPRTVPVLVGHEQNVLCMKDGHEPDERVFLSIPKHLDVHSYRREYAQALYLSYAPGWTLPPSEGRLRSSDYHTEAVQAVSRALGHNRKDVVIRHYIR